MITKVSYGIFKNTTNVFKTKAPKKYFNICSTFSHKFISKIDVSKTRWFEKSQVLFSGENI